MTLSALSAMSQVSAVNIVCPRPTHLAVLELLRPRSPPIPVAQERHPRCAHERHHVVKPCATALFRLVKIG